MPQSTLKDLFEVYTEKNPDEEWIQKYKEACARVAAIKTGQQELTLDIAKYLWTSHDTGVTTISRAQLPVDFFDKHSEVLVELARQLIISPTPESFDKVIAQWSKWKKTNEIDWIPWAATTRILAAADPKQFTSCVSNWIYDVFRYLRDAHGLYIPRTGNWAQQNITILKRVRAEGLEDADPITLNTFLWWLVDDHLRTKGIIYKDVKPITKRITSGVLASNAPMPPLPPLNTIFYGPPGTGKTFQMGLIKDTLFTSIENQASNEQWEEELFGGLSWWKVAAAALQDLGGHAKMPQLKEHRFVQAKFRTSQNKHLMSTLWENLPSHTPLESTQVNYDHGSRRPPFIFDKDSDSTWRLLDGWDEQCPEILEALNRYGQGPPSGTAAKRYEFITFHQSYSYEEFIEGIRPLLTDDDAQGELRYELVDGVFKKLSLRAENDPDAHYALFIDEINRGNISKIFGELITLIEESKRKGGKEPITVRLPYSRELFSVPSNLHIIGTMNTADRSLALMDTALRRRFSFVEVMPKPSLLEGVMVSDNDLTVNITKLLETMNQRIELLYDREHTIGHAFFMGQDWETPNLDGLRTTFSRKIIPLLQEYFFEDWEKIRLVLGDNQKEMTDPGLAFIRKEEVQESDLFGNGGLNGMELTKYEPNQRALDDIRAYIGIYDSNVIGESEEEGQD